MKSFSQNKGLSRLLAGSLASAVAVGTLATAPIALGYGGEENNPEGMKQNPAPPGSGIVWGVGEEGTYFLDGPSGPVQGFCIDPGAAFPRQAEGTKYGAPVSWDKANGLSGADKQAIVNALVVGKIVNEGKGKIFPMLGQLGLSENLDVVAAAASAIVHQTGSTHDPSNKPGSGPWNPSRLPGEAKADFDKIKSITPEKLQEVTGVDVNSVDIQIYMPENEAYQRMLAVDALEIPKAEESPKTTESDKTTSEESPKTTEPEKTTSEESPKTTESDKTTSEAPKTTERTSRSRYTNKPSSSTRAPMMPTTSSSAPTEQPKKPSIRTSAGEKESNVVEKGATIVDTVSYEGLKPGQEYNLKATAMDKETGAETGDTGYKTFVPSGESGTVDVEIPVKNDSSDQIVMFEELIDQEGKTVAEHKDLADTAQTVGTPEDDSEDTPEIRTNASSSTGNRIETGSVVSDTVSYQGLNPDEEYTLEAKLMCKADGSDTGASQTHEFTPEDSSGETVVEGINVTNPDCKEQVAFEKLYDSEGFLVASHEDINDAAQTVGGEVAHKKTPTPPQARAEATASANAPGMGNGNPAPRQVITNIPSGQSEVNGETIFTR